VALHTKRISGSGSSRAGSFSRKFGLSPFTVLNAREGWWQRRKKQWIALGIASDDGRPRDLLFSKSSNAFLTKEGKKAFAAKLDNRETVND